MTKEEKQLLLKDLCTRLPYGVKYNYGGNEGCDYTMDRISLIAVDDAFPIEDIRPYLRPMSFMTEEEQKFYYSALYTDIIRMEFYNSRYLDYNHLIEKGLALEAPEGMYKIDKLYLED